MFSGKMFYIFAKVGESETLESHYLPMSISFCYYVQIPMVEKGAFITNNVKIQTKETAKGRERE